MLVVPAIDIKGRKCVRLVQGDYDRQKVFFDDPVEVASMLRVAGIKRVHVIDLDGARGGTPVNLDLVEEISKMLEIQFGGGIRDVAVLDKVISSGVRWVIVGTVAALKEKEFQRWLSVYGDRIILSIDAAYGVVKVSGWQEEAGGLKLYDFFDRAVSLGVKTVIFTDISRDGTLEGINTALVEGLVRRKGTTELFVAGGISSVDDLYTLERLGVDGAVVGRAFYEGKITVREMVKFAGK